MSSAKTFGLPADFDKLPSFEFSRAPAASRNESARTDKIFGVQSLAQLTEEADRRLDTAGATPKPSGPSSANAPRPPNGGRRSPA